MSWAMILKRIQQKRDPTPPGPKMSKDAPIKIVSSTSDNNILRWCTLALQHRCHFRNGYGSMESWYNTPKRIESIAVALHDGIPVGVAVAIRNKARGADGLHNVGIYVKYNFRRLGIGTKLAKRLKKRTRKLMIPSRWDQQAESFYDSTEID